MEIKAFKSWHSFFVNYWCPLVVTLVLTIITALGLLNLRETFSGDQALFLVYAKEINNGGILYTDFWDIKQPGIFIFYLVAGKLFGFNEFGIHLFELIYWLVLVAIMIIGLRRYFTNPVFAVITPILTVGIYYTVSESLHLTQVESLVGLPLFLTLWFGQKFLENPNRKYLLILSGICGGCAIIFKLLFVALLFFFWGILLLYSYFLLKNTFSRIFSQIGLILLGLAIPLGIVIFYFAQNNALSVLYYTTFIYPINAIATLYDSSRTEILKSGLIWFLKAYFPVIALCLFFLLLELKNALFNRQNEVFASDNFLFRGLIGWLIIGFGLIFAQRLSWWEYHYSLEMIPLGILAMKGLDNFFAEIKHRFQSNVKQFVTAGILLITVCLFIPTVRRLTNKLKLYYQTEIVKTGNKELLVMGENLQTYHQIADNSKFFAAQKTTPKLFVIANPLYYYFLDSSPIISSNGWMPEFFTDEEWTKLESEIITRKPEFIFLQQSAKPIITEKCPRLFEIINKNYDVHTNNSQGSFYRLR